ncbi:winged helix-turn-helix domain-containing protein [Wenxinia saemankumensis]|uniref:Winged helix-turn-helix domain-containing protein n=1 Tax=Wenxinia saemankumensis TaxID=1447782 RepID=A0A1M6EVM5_9RHOB|nr:crosslink repair DNA glycosylase YcaQ family protein [Wenxinia saemankumensis]SHI89491.1 hypothetical protein SAMN05444417_2201 [Wenxinia saemankumensis]
MRPVLTNALARRVFLDRHLLLRDEGGPGRGTDLADLVTRLGFVQVDSVNTLARAHDLILWSRRGRYRPRALELAVARDRTLFEGWTHDASAIPMPFWPHWRHRFARMKDRLPGRWEAWQRHDFLSECDGILARIEAEGGLASADTLPAERDPAAAGGPGWWNWHPSKTALEYLWHTGSLAVCHRRGFQKVYDLTERVIPADLRAASPAPEETIDWACRMALDRLGFATGGELAAFLALATPQEVKGWVAGALARGEVEEIAIEGADGSRRTALARPGLVEAAERLPPPGARVRVLSPFDPMLRDRARAERLFGFRYRIEIFVPEAKRRWGYYVFPVWEGDRAIGRIDMARRGGDLAIRAFWPEEGVRMGRGRLQRLEAELERVAGFAGLAGIDRAPDWLRDGPPPV